MTDTLQPGTVIGGRYKLVESAGEGGMATVWRAVTQGASVFERTVAVKAMKRNFSSKRDHLDMFLEEARIGAELQHPHLIQVFDFVPDVHGAHCLIMEWIEGTDLRTMTKVLADQERPLPWALVAHVGVGVLRGLASAHERKLRDGSLSPVIHRDVAPQNILLGLNGCIKLSDFGMARARDRSAGFTAPGFVKGTLSYMAPELLTGKPPTPAADQFSLGCTLWEALAGERLFDARSDAEVYAQIREGRVRPLEQLRPDAPARFVNAIHRALAMKPEDRFDTARAMIRELYEVIREFGPAVDSDVIVGRTVAQTREASE